MLALNSIYVGDSGIEVKIPFLPYSDGLHITAYICSVSSPASFTAQPYGPQLVNFMHELRYVRKYMYMYHNTLIMYLYRGCITYYD